MLYFLHLASISGKIEVVKELLNQNADIEAKDNNGNTPLILGIFLNF
jgi:ankyrin repeat protein